MDRNLVLLNRNIVRRDVRLQSCEIEQLIAADLDGTPAAQRLMRAQIGELSSAIRQLQLSGLDAAAPRLLISRKRAELDDLTHRTNHRSQGD